MMIRNPDWKADVRESFARQGMLRSFSAEIAHAAPGEVWLTAPITDAVTQQDGFAHAGLGWSIGDSAAGYAALSLMEKGDRVLTAEMKINLMRPATGAALLARGRVLRAGRQLLTVASDIFAIAGETETHIATMLGTMACVKP